MKKICIQCNKEYKNRNKKSKFCSNSCCTSSHIGIKMALRSEEHRKKLSEALKGKKKPPRSEEHRRKLRESNLGKTRSKETKEKNRQAHLGKKHGPMSEKQKIQIGNTNRGKIRPQELRDRISKSLTGVPHSVERRINRKAKKGKDHWNWQNGKTSENETIRMSLEMKLFRKSCMERDDFTCQKTGQRGGKLVVHHINNFRDFPELRTSISNGITLSKESHIEFHKIYGFKNNTKEQLLEFLNNKNI